MALAGTTHKWTTCDKRIYLVDKLITVILSNYISFEDALCCRPRFNQLFKKKKRGSLDKSTLQVIVVSSII
ncbi:hypothetical protein Hanom_Chr15g01341041 [Helianthus anomalus]